MDILETVMEIIVEHHDVRRDELSPDTNIHTDLDNDSLEFGEIIMGCEEAFGVSIPDAVAECIETIGDLVEYIQTQRQPSL